MSNHNRSSPLPYFFRTTPKSNNTSSSSLATKHHSKEAPPHFSGNPNLTTCLYNTDLGLFALTWSRNLCSRSLHLHFLLDHPSASASNNHHNNPSFPSLSTPSFHLHIKPFFFWNKHGSKNISTNNTTTKSNIQIYWDLSRAKFGSGPEPQSGYFIAVVIAGVMILLVGDSPKEAYSKTRASTPQRNQVTVLRREHVYGNKLYTTKASFAGKEREISIDCRHGEDPRLYFNVDNKTVLRVKHLKWKFRGNERIEVDGVHIQVSWDVHNWLFEDDEDGYALFMFRFERLGFDDEDQYFNNLNDKNGMILLSQQSCGFEFETKKMKKGLLRTTRSSSSSSLSSASSSCSSVMEWASVEENELKGPSGFSLLVYAWKS
ncbi:unnamed protein product [Ilex paraguariensis]|uniref:DUF868 domain-containing protein n=1 Tax=Ilex paraguariensis TaxID=185542 RepID=A0ABC8US02_9AQUA